MRTPKTFNGCSIYPNILQVTPTPALTCYCASPGSGLWDGTLVKTGVCRYISPLTTNLPFLARLNKVSGLWTLEYYCINSNIEVTLWSGALQQAAPIGTFTYLAGCDTTPNFSLFDPNFIPSPDGLPSYKLEIANFWTYTMSKESNDYYYDQANWELKRFLSSWIITNRNIINIVDGQQVNLIWKKDLQSNSPSGYYTLATPTVETSNKNLAKAGFKVT